MPLIVSFADWLLTIFIYLIVFGAILSWFPSSRGHAVTRFIDSITSPLLTPFRAIIPTLGGMDFSPLLAMLLLSFLRRLLHTGLVP
jgi:YggT family protein